MLGSDTQSEVAATGRENDTTNDIRGIEDEDLIDAVRSRPVLYRFDEDDYRNVDKKNDAWNEIAQTLHSTGISFN